MRGGLNWASDRKATWRGETAVAGPMVLYQISHFQVSHTISEQTKGLPQNSAGWEGDVGKGCKPEGFTTISHRTRSTNSTGQSQSLQLRCCHGQDAPFSGPALLQNCIIFVRKLCPALDSGALYPGKGISSSRAQLMGLDLPCARQFFIFPLQVSFADVLFPPLIWINSGHFYRQHNIRC